MLESVSDCLISRGRRSSSSRRGWFITWLSIAAPPDFNPSTITTLIFVRHSWGTVLLLILYCRTRAEIHSKFNLLLLWLFVIDGIARASNRLSVGWWLKRFLSLVLLFSLVLSGCLCSLSLGLPCGRSTCLARTSAWPIEANRNSRFGAPNCPGRRL